MRKAGAQLFSITKLAKAFLYSLDGLKAAFAGEMAFRLECVIAAVALPVVFILNVSLVEKTAMLGSILLVMIVELINTGIEAVVDIASPEKHPLAKKAKDTASAAVLLSVLLVIAVWVSVLWDKI